MKLKFTKMQAYGNDYVYMDAIHQNIENPNLLSKKYRIVILALGPTGWCLSARRTVAIFA